MSDHERADLGFGAALDDLHLESWSARPAPPAPLHEETRHRAETLGSRSR